MIRIRWQGMKTIILEMMVGAGSGYMVPLMENYPGFDLISGAFYALTGPP